MAISTIILNRLYRKMKDLTYPYINLDRAGNELLIMKNTNSIMSSFAWCQGTFSAFSCSDNIKIT